MSRTYYEWMAAKQKWHLEQGLRVASIPYPHESIEYPVVYTRQSTNDFWERRRSAAEELIPYHHFMKLQNSDIYNFINATAAFERQKETDFLSKFGTDESLKGKSPTDQFNILFQSKDIYEKINERISNTLTSKQNQKNKTSKKHEYYTGMAPNLNALFASYLETSLSAAMSRVREKITADTDISKMQSLFETAFEQAILEASDKMTQITLDNNYGTGEEWAPIDQMLRSDSRAKELFMGVIKQAIGADNIDNMLTTMRTQKKVGEKKQTARTIVRNHLKLASQTAQIGGTVAEQTMAFLLNSLNGMKGGSDLKFQVYGEGIQGNMVRTDTTFLFSTNLDLDLRAVMMELNQSLSSNTDMLKAYEKFQDFYNKTQKNMEELYAVFVNAKNYSLGHDAHNYTQHQKGTFEELPGFLTRAGFSVGSVRNFLLLAYNTGEGSVRANQSADFMEDCVNALKAMAAKLMFDDYEQIGQGGANSIHMFYLSGKYVPSSVVFQAMADAIGSAKELSKASITLPSPVKYKSSDSYGIEAKSDADFKEKLMTKWAEESARAQSEARWEVEFTLKIKQILSDL